VIIFPLELKVLHFFTIRGGDAAGKKNLYLMLSGLNFIDYGFIEITYRKCVVQTSVKGLDFDYIQI
jgi:ABC-type uncharacterized transport system ATPase component